MLAPLLELGLIEILGLIIIVATILGYFARLLKQPAILAYIITGFILGPYGLAIITNQSEMLALSELGIAFLLFAVGLELNLGKLRKVGKEIVFVSITQILFTFLITYFIFLFLGFNKTLAIYFGLATSFSSTMVVVKLLSDKKKINSLSGRLTIGILIIQDLVVILVLSLIPNIQNSFSTNLTLILVSGIGLISLAIVLNRFVFPYLLKYTAKTRELFFLLSLSTVFLFIILCKHLGFSIAIGGFIAGLTLATYPYNIEIESEIKPLYNFFLAIFLASLGMQINFGLFVTFLPIILLLFLIVIIIKPAIIFTSLRLLKYKGRVPITVSIPLAQASAFTFVLVQEGLKVGQLSSKFASLLITFTLLSLAASPYLFSLSFKIANKIARGKAKIEKKKFKNHIILLGCHRSGKYLIENLRDKVVAVDHDPEVIEDLKKRGYNCIYGEGDNRDILEVLNVKKAKIVVSTLPDLETNLYIINVVKEISKNTIVIAKAFTILDALELYREGADFVIIPMRLAGERLLRETKNILSGERDIKKLREREIMNLKEEFVSNFLV